MGNEYALVGNVLVPPLLAAVFKDVVLVLVQVTGNLDSLIGLLALGVEHGQGVIGVVDRRDIVQPAHEVLLIGAVSDGRVTADRTAVVASIIHQAPVSHAIVTGIVGGVEVGQTQTVRELMAERADTVHDGASVATTINLVKHGKAIDYHTIECLRSRSIAIIGSRSQIPLARPDATGNGVTGLCLTHTGVHDDTHIGLAVSVVVILAPVNVITGDLDCMAHHRRHASVIALTVVAAIVGTLVRQFVDAIEVVLRGVLAVALVGEILVHALFSVLVLRFKVRHRVRHLLVGVLHQDDGHARAAQGGHLCFTCLARTSRGLTGLSTRGHCHGLLHRSLLALDEAQLSAGAVHGVVRHHARDARGGHVVEVALFGDADGQAVLGDKEVEELVTHRLDGDLRTVALGVGLEPAFGRHGQHHAPGAEQNHQ